ncbi:hypothetical protein [Streptomyces sp. MMG1121]|uniref:hypothetical protein n=1 Tax=Streptomyces sp. MMG1121 TaxID=1415544 RepID=UPI00131DEA9A|nr:hypothetical protein [Streptomyces sp. MMG1121]
MTCVLPAAGPAAASTSACTHHWSGPQVCIRLDGRNEWNRVTAIWANPPGSAKTRNVWLTLDGKRLGRAETARRVGKTLSYTWSAFDTGTDTKVCVQFAKINRVACDTTKYSGVPGSV